MGLYQGGTFRIRQTKTWEAQVRESIEQSFKNLKVEYIDDILMLQAPHSKMKTMTLLLGRYLRPLFRSELADFGVFELYAFRPAFKKLFADGDDQNLRWGSGPLSRSERLRH